MVGSPFLSFFPLSLLMLSSHLVLFVLMFLLCFIETTNYKRQPVLLFLMNYYYFVFCYRKEGIRVADGKDMWIGGIDLL